MQKTDRFGNDIWTKEAIEAREAMRVWARAHGRRQENPSESRGLVTDSDGNVHVLGDTNVPDFSEMAWANLDADHNSAFDDMFHDTDQIVDGEGIWEQMAFDAPDATLMADAEFEEWEAKQSLMDGLEYNPTPTPVTAMNCRINGQNVTNGVQAERIVRVHELLVAVASHVLVAKHGMNAELVAMSGPEVLAVVQTACEAAIALGMTPSEIGFTALFNQCGELQDRVETNKPKSVLPPAISRTVSPTPPVKAAATVKTITRPNGSDWAGRIETCKGLALRCTCNRCSNGKAVVVLETAAVVPSIWEAKRILGNSVVGSYDLWRIVRAPGHHGRSGMTLFTEAMAGIMETESKMKGNNTLLRRIEDMELKDAPSFRLGHFVVPLDEPDFKKVNRIFSKRGRRTPSDWQALHGALGTSSDERIREAMKLRITVWEAREQGLNMVVDLRVLTQLCRDAIARRQDQRSWEIRKAGFERRRAQNA
ncbi:MAG: hypothetical protein HQ488_00495 [Parcubacteria group bacterium]|nr:hypothetical protein [Parcubacteria group bacterium]